MKTLKEIRETQGVKQNSVAEHIGVSRQTYAGYETNPQSMTIAQALAVCEFLHCQLNDIFLEPKVN